MLTRLSLGSKIMGGFLLFAFFFFSLISKFSSSELTLL